MAPVVQWQVVGTFAPSFFTGRVVERHDAPRITQTGIRLLPGNVAIALLGVEWLHFVAELILPGIGWNFAFTGATALPTQSCQPASQSTVQASNEFAVFGVVALIERPGRNSGLGDKIDPCTLPSRQINRSAGGR